MNSQIPAFPVPIIRLILPSSEGGVLILQRSGNPIQCQHEMDIETNFINELAG